MRPTFAPMGRAHGSRMRTSMASSSSSSSLTPPRAKNLMPLSGMGLCDAEIMTPRSASSTAVRCATAGVGRTPTSKTSTPALARPADTAAARNSPDARGSRPMTAVGRCPANAPASPRTCAAATARSRASSAVRSTLAMPRTPSVPKSRSAVTCRLLLPRGTPPTDKTAPREAPPRRRYAVAPPGHRRTRQPVAHRRTSALGVLGSLAGLLEAVLLPLLGPRVARQEAGLLQRRPVALDVDLVEAAGHAEAKGAGLT